MLETLVDHKYYIVDAFSKGHQRWTGNPAAVVVLTLPHFPDDNLLMKIAREFNLSETAFLLPQATTPQSLSEKQAQSQSHYCIRWFTPTMEIALCGHATLASAHVLYNYYSLPSTNTIHFHSLSGELICESGCGKVTMSFPELKPVAIDNSKGELSTGILAKALRIPEEGNIKWVGRNKFDVVVEVGENVDIEKLEPELNDLAKIQTRAIIVTAKSNNSQFDIISRVFAPACGIPEDPVTGSAHCGLAPYWLEKLNKIQLTAFQAMPGRGGILYLTCRGDGRVHLTGDAVTVMKGQLL